MEKLVKGDIVVIPFPYSDLSNAKRRPAFVVNSGTNQEIILCQITSQQPKDDYFVSIANDDFIEGSLNHKSHVRINRIFTANNAIVHYKAGSLTSKKIEEIIKKLVNLIIV